jgi:hypothetical protein
MLESLKKGMRFFISLCHRRVESSAFLFIHVRLSSTGVIVTAQDSKVTSARDQAKPSPEHDAIKRIADGAVSEFHKLLDEVYGKPADKKLAAKPAEAAAKTSPATPAKDAPKPTAIAQDKSVHPAVPEKTAAAPEKPVAASPAKPASPAPEKLAAPATAAPQSSANSGLWGWLSTGEKAAENAISVAKNYVQKETQAIVSAGAALLTSSESSTAAPTASAKPVAAKPETPATPAAVPPTDATPAVDPAQASSVFSDAATWVENTVSSAAKSVASTLSSPATEQALMVAAAAMIPGGGVVAPAIVGAAAAAESLPSMVGTAGLAVQAFQKNFGFDGDKAQSMERFNETAEHIKSIDDLPDYQVLSTSQTAQEKQYALEAAKEANIGWMFAGQNTPGGDTTIIGQNGKVDATGVTAGGDKVHAVSTLEKQVVTGGLTTAIHDADGTHLQGSAFNSHLVGDEMIVSFKNAENQPMSARFNTKTHEIAITGGNIHGTAWLSADDFKTQVGNDQFHQLAAGEAPQKVADATATGGVQYYTDADGNMGAVTSDNIKYQFFKSKHLLVVTKNDKVMHLDTVSGQVTLFTRDAKTGSMTQVKLTNQNMAKGWALNADGTININGTTLQDRVTKDVNIGLNGVMHLAESKITALTTEGTTTLSSNGGSTTLTTPDGSGDTRHPDGTVTLTENGKPLVTLDPKDLSIKSDKTDEKVQFDTKTQKLNDVEGSTGQITTLDRNGNASSHDAHGRLLFNMNGQGDIQLYDGTEIKHDGTVYNARRGINELSYASQAAAEAQKSQAAQEVVKTAAAKAESIAASMPGGLDASIASLQSILSQLNALGDVPEMAEQIGAAKATVEAKLAAAIARESMTSKLTHAGLNSTSIEQAFAARGSGMSEDQIVDKMTQQQAQPTAA